MNYYNEIKNKIIDNEIYSKVKDYSKERHKVITYFEIGRLLKEAGADKSVIALKSLDAMAKVADGKATKIIIPSDLQNIATLGVTLSESLNDTKKRQAPNDINIQ